MTDQERNIKPNGRRPLSINIPSTTIFEKSGTVQRVKSLLSHNENGGKKIIRRTESFGPLEELVQCGICMERLNQPKMLPCQHTFCLSCLETHIIAKDMINNPEKKEAINRKMLIACIICKKEIVLDNGLDTLETLPTNLYINSLLAVLNNKNSTPTTPVVDLCRCIKCQTVFDYDLQKCQHCKLNFCSLCYADHLKELQSKLIDFLTQLNESEKRLDFKCDDFVRRNVQLNETINSVLEEKIAKLREEKDTIFMEIEAISKNANITSKELKNKLAFTKDEINACFTNNKTDDLKVGSLKDKVVETYMQMHKNISKLLDEVSHWGETRLIFDPNTFELDEDENPNFDDQSYMNVIASNPLDSIDNLKFHYKKRVFTSKLVWNRCPKPAGVGIPSWSPNLLYIAGTDSKTVTILNRNNNKVVGNLNHDDMLCPHSIAFHDARKEIFVSDRYKHCIHVFSIQNEYIRTICSRGHNKGNVLSPQGIAMSPDGNIILCDTGNDRVVVLDPENGAQIGTVGADLNMPTAVAVSSDKIVIADTGNHRVKVYNMDGDKIQTIGFLGTEKGQFRSAEAVAIDPLGFILVGDAGNRRLQIFDKDGDFVRMLNSSPTSGNFKWISGIAVTDELEIIITDFKSKSLHIF